MNDGQWYWCKRCGAEWLLKENIDKWHDTYQPSCPVCRNFNYVQRGVKQSEIKREYFRCICCDTEWEMSCPPLDKCKVYCPTCKSSKIAHKACEPWRYKKALANLLNPRIYYPPGSIRPVIKSVPTDLNKKMRKHLKSARNRIRKCEKLLRGEQSGGHGVDESVENVWNLNYLDESIRKDAEYCFKCKTRVTIISQPELVLKDGQLCVSIWKRCLKCGETEHRLFLANV